ncbi:MAG: DNA ligase, partial [Candidatus Thioglobus sp.]
IKFSLICWLLLQTAFAKPDLFLLKTYDDNKSVVGWVMSEKLDGVRGFWDGEKLITRSGNLIHTPSWFIKNYPPYAIDGELWTKRGDFENISSIVRTKNADQRWRQITHQIFEVPNQSGGLLDRLAILKTYLVANPNTPIRIIPQVAISIKKQLSDYLEDVVNDNGEGVVVRNPNALYQTGRLSSALKVKKYFDTECIVLKILPGNGKYINMMGSVVCQTDTGKQVKIGSGFKHKDRVNPPIVGSKITFKYYGFTNKGNFKYPVYLRVRVE